MSMDFDPSALREEDSRDFERIANIKESTQRFISALQIEREPEIERTILSFDPGTEYEPKNLPIPKFIQRNLQADTHVHQLWIDATVNRLTREGSIGIYASAASIIGDVVVAGVTVSGDQTEQPETAFVIGDSDMPILEPTTLAEFNQYLASLFTLSKTGDYSDFNAMNLKDIEILERLIDAIASTDVETIKHSTYILSGTLSHITDSLTYVEQDDSPIQADVTIEHHGKASTYEIDIVNDKNHTDLEALAADEDTEFMMQALDGIRTYTQNIDGERKQIPSTNDGLRVLDDFLAERSASVFMKSPEETFLRKHDIDPSLTINVEDTVKDTSELD